MDNKVFKKDYILDNVLPSFTNRYNRRNHPEYVHTGYLDLIIEYYVPLPTNDDFVLQSYRLTENHLQTLDISIDELRRKAIRHMAKHARCLAMSDILTGLVPDCDHFPMYVITNDNTLYGATAMLCIDILDFVGDILGEPFIILPSSIHEVIAIPTGFAVDLNELVSTVKDINNTVVAEQDKLSDSVYIYERGDVSIYRN